jgi:hypothetical protein
MQHTQPGNVDTSTNWTHFYAKIQTSLPGGSGTQFTCCTSTKVQILTLKARREGGGGGVRRRGISKGRSRDDSCLSRPRRLTDIVVRDAARNVLQGGQGNLLVEKMLKLSRVAGGLLYTHTHTLLNVCCLYVCVLSS